MSELIAFDSNHTKSINDCELDYYSKKLATCSNDNTVKIFDVSLAREPICIAEIRDHTSAVWKVCWSHPKYGSLLASCSYDKSVIIYKEVSINKYDMIYVNNEHKSSVNYIEWSPSEYGLHLGCACLDGHLSIISYNFNKGPNEGGWHKHSVRAHLNGVSCLSWEKPFNLISENKNINDTNDAITSFKLVSGGYDNQVIIWMFDNNTKEFHKIFQMNDKPHNSLIKDVAWRPNLNDSTNMIASCSEEKIVILWIEDTSNNRWKNGQIIKLEHKVHKISWSPNGTILAIACSNENSYLYKENMEGVWEEICNLSDNEKKKLDESIASVDNVGAPIENSDNMDGYNNNAPYMNTEGQHMLNNNINYPNQMNNMPYGNELADNSKIPKNMSVNSSMMQEDPNMLKHSSVQGPPPAMPNNAFKNNPYGQGNPPIAPPISPSPMNPNMAPPKITPPGPAPPSQLNPIEKPHPSDNPKFPGQQIPNHMSNAGGALKYPPDQQAPPTAVNNMPNNNAYSFNPVNNKPNIPPSPPQMAGAPNAPPMGPPHAAFQKGSTDALQYPPPIPNANNNLNNNMHNNPQNVPPSFSKMPPPMNPGQFPNMNENKSSFSSQQMPGPPPPAFPPASNEMSGMNKVGNFPNYNPNMMNNPNAPPLKNMSTGNCPPMSYGQSPTPPMNPPMNPPNDPNYMKPNMQYNSYPNYNYPRQ
ncbi:protein transport protein SEC13, putative [Plasmodium vinckei lentum]|uniref:Protein transport protein SEC13, putative n=1 Tax=Plasmodium vinckei lentum TaxID=138297 RepID=A0A6V7SZH4_PLAVN|nr:protein transport protein SEC13, putative [Plasmodium vinckei lentum]